MIAHKPKSRPVSHTSNRELVIFLLCSVLAAAGLFSYAIWLSKLVVPVEGIECNRSVGRCMFSCPNDPFSAPIANITALKLKLSSIDYSSTAHEYLELWLVGKKPFFITGKGYAGKTHDEWARVVADFNKFLATPTQERFDAEFVYEDKNLVGAWYMAGLCAASAIFFTILLIRRRQAH